MNLYELSESYRNLLELVDNEEVPQEVLQESLNQLEGSINEKVENTAKVLKSIDADIKALDEEIKRLTARKKALTGRVESLKSYMLGNMKLANINKVKGRIMNVSIRKSEAVNILNEDLIGEEYKQVTYKINKTDIKKAIKEGKTVNGAEIIKNESISIR